MKTKRTIFLSAKVFAIPFAFGGIIMLFMSMYLKGNWSGAFTAGGIVAIFFGLLFLGFGTVDRIGYTIEETLEEENEEPTHRP